MTVDPLRDQLAANCDAHPESEDYGRAERALQDYDEMKARGTETAPGAIRNALMILDLSDDFEYGDDYRAVARLLKHALAQLEGSPLRAPQDTER